MPSAAAPPDAEPRAREVLASLLPRRVVGASVADRVGARAWGVPRFAKGRRMFRRCGLPDPWDPEAPEVRIELGDVGLAARRLPAPHAAPPGAGKASASPAATPGGGSGDRLAHLPPHIRAMIASGGGARPEGRPAPRIGDVRPDDTAALKAKPAADRRTRPPPPSPARVSQPVARLPVRPDLDPSRAPAGAAPVSAAAPRPAPPRRPPLPPGTGTPGRPPPGTPVRPAGPPVVRPPSPAPPASPAVRPGSPPPAAAAPVAPPAPERPTAPPPAPAGPAPVDRSPTGGRAVGLDDLFGMGAAGEHTRVRLGATGEGSSRKPKVTDPSQLSGGVDRRPPRLPSPAVSPSPGSASPPAPDEPADA